MNKHNCKEQEMYIVQDQPLPASETLLLRPLSSLYKVYTRNQELSQPGESRPVMSPSQHTLSKEMMKNMDFREDNIKKATNKRMLEQMALHAPQTIKATSTQDLDPLPLARRSLKNFFFLSSIPRRQVKQC